MAAPRCSCFALKIAKSVWLFRPSTILNQQARYRNCIPQAAVLQSIRLCSQFTIKAEQMDGNYRLKEDTVREGEKPKNIAPYIERRNRYYQSRAYMVKKYQWQGKSSGIDPAIMWPTKAELEKLKAYEKEWCPSLEEMKEELEAERKQRRLGELKRKKIIAANMAKMPQWLKEFDDKIDEEKRKEEQQKKKRAKLLEEARVKLGYHVDHRSRYFKSMLEEMELEEKKRRKEEKKKARRAKLGVVKLEEPN